MLQGRIDVATRWEVSGWAFETELPDAPVSLIVTANDEPVERVLANRFRPDLKAAGIGDGRRGFRVAFAGRLSTERQVIRVRRESDGSELPDSPQVLESPEAFDDTMRRTVASALGALETEPAIRSAIEFLAEETESLLVRRSDRLGSRSERLAAKEHRLRWRGRADASDGPGEPPPRALVVDDALPAARGGVGADVLVSHLRSLQRLGFEVTVAPADMAAGPAALELERLGIATVGAPWFSSVEEVLRRQGDTLDLVYLHRVTTASAYLSLVRRYAPRARLIYGVGDLHHVRLARQGETEQRPELLAMSRWTRAEELRAAAASDAVITHSSAEAELLRREAPLAQVHLVRWALSARPTPFPFAARLGFAFVGSFGEAADLDAARWLVDEILPEVLAREPGMRLLLAGSRMPDDLRRLSRPGLEPIGETGAPEDVCAAVRLTIAPLNFGAGVKAEILASLAAGAPCVCTPPAAEGLDLPAELQGLVAESAADLADLVVRLHQDEAMNSTCSAAGLAYVAEHLSEPKLDAALRVAAGLPASRAQLSNAELAGDDR